MKLRAAFVATTLMGVALVNSMTACSRRQADLIIHGGKVYTMNAASPSVEAVVVVGERIVFAGDLDGARRYQGEETRTLDLDGRTMLPGLVDAHAHLRSLGRYLAQLKLEAARSPAEVREIVRQAQESTPPGRWIQGRGWDENDWASREFPTWRDLHGTEQNPVYLRRVDGHAAWVNEAALALCEITKDTPDPDGGRIVRDADGEPTGVFVDNAMELIAGRIPEASASQIDDWMRAAIRHCNSLGLVGIHDAGIDSSDLASLIRLHERGELTFRVYCMLSTDDEDLAWTEEQIRRGPRTEADGRVVVRAVKLYADGALGSRGAALLEPYSDDPDNSGLLVTPPEQLERLSRLALDNGFQVCTHAIGDRGNRVILDVYEEVLRGYDGDARFRVEHAQVLSLEDIPRFNRLGVIPSMQPTHCTSDMYWAEDRVGPRRIEGAYAWRRLIDAGCSIPCGSDFPVESADPLKGVYAAVTRQDAEGWPEGGWHPGQRMTIEEVLKGFTIYAAYAAFAEDETGSIEAGKLADFTVIDRDPFAVPPEEILGTRVVYTVVGGQFAYSRAGGGSALSGASSRAACAR
jgi:predicted amidohydrolase YtcJ